MNLRCPKVIASIMESIKIIIQILCVSFNIFYNYMVFCKQGQWTRKEQHTHIWNGHRTSEQWAEFGGYAGTNRISSHDSGS